MREADQKVSDETTALLREARRAGLNLGFVRYRPDRGIFADKVRALKAPALWVVADIGGHDESHGPESFDVVSLLALREAVTGVVLNEAAPEARHFGMAIARALLRRETVAIVETTERHCADWNEFWMAKRGGPPVMMLVIARAEKGRA